MQVRAEVFTLSSGSIVLYSVHCSKTGFLSFKQLSTAGKYHRVWNKSTPGPQVCVFCKPISTNEITHGTKSAWSLSQIHCERKQSRMMGSPRQGCLSMCLSSSFPSALLAASVASRLVAVGSLTPSRSSTCDRVSDWTFVCSSPLAASMTGCQAFLQELYPLCA